MAGDLIEQLEFRSWGNLFAPRHRVLPMRDRSASLPRSDRFLLPYGSGRSYGDSCLNDGNALIRARDLDRLIAFDPVSGVLRCEAGVMLAEILDFAMPKGWFLPVTPGTKFVTLGGAIANDVHGKNHHRDGTFGHHVPRFELLRSDGTRRTCSASEDSDLYRATIGGLGLTGLITWADIQLRKVTGPWIKRLTRRFESLDHFFELCDPLERDHQYVVAWLDCTARDPRAARGIVFAGDHDNAPDPAPAERFHTFLFKPPFPLVNGLTLRAFNELYYCMAKNGKLERIPYGDFFYPLDTLLDWNRLYGPRGFFQYQCLVPEAETGRSSLAEILSCVADSGQGSFLSVLKRFGRMPSVGMMSFPRPGYTLALDFPNRGGRTLQLLDQLDALVESVGGSVYPAKDSRMSPASFRAFYPDWQRFSGFIDPKFSSSFWRRVTGTMTPAGAR